jgi:hypothetical protein
MTLDGFDHVFRAGRYKTATGAWATGQQGQRRRQDGLVHPEQKSENQHKGERPARKNHPKAEAMSSLRARKLLKQALRVCLRAGFKFMNQTNGFKLSSPKSSEISRCSRRVPLPEPASPTNPCGIIEGLVGDAG